MRPASIRSLRSTGATAPARGRARGRAGVAVMTAMAIAGLAIVLFGGGGARRRGLPPGRSSGGSAPRWVTGWATALIRPPGSLGARGLGPGTVRILLPSAIGGDAVRIELSNRFGGRPVPVGSATVGVTGRSGGVGDMRPITFSRRVATTLPPGGSAVSDPVALPVPAARAQLAVSLWLPAGTGSLTAHPGPSVPVYMSAGDRTADRATPPSFRRLPAVPLLSSVAVRTTTSTGALVIIGGSAAAGGGGELASGLAAEMARLPTGRRLAVLDEALAGNRVLAGTPATGAGLVARLGSDALDLPGVRSVIVLAGADDLAAARGGAAALTASRLEQAYATMIRAAARARVSLYLGTLPPLGGAGAERAASNATQAIREQVNGWIRTAAAHPARPGVAAALDFDAVLRDPRDWRRLRSGDGSRASSLPNRAGYRAVVRYVGAALSASSPFHLPKAPSLAPALLPAGAPAMVEIGSGPPGPAFSPGGVGLSVEASVLSAPARPTLDPVRGDLASIMRLLGPGLLRIAGDAADLSFFTATGERAPRWAQVTITPADLSRLAALARATGWRVLLTVNLGHFDPARAASEAAAAKRRLGRALAGIEIGNEPDRYVLQKLRPAAGWTYGAYISELDRYRSAIAAAAPGVPVAGPDLSSTTWTLRYARSQGPRDGEITQHYYPLWACQGSRPTIADLLGTRARAREDALVGLLSRADSVAGRPAAISETNSVACSGASAVSPRFAAALWALDWALRAARGGVRQIEFHDQLAPCTSRTYSPLCSSSPAAAAAGELAAQPVLYGMLAAARLEGGHFLPVSVQGPGSITAYATLQPGGRVQLAIDNLSPAGRPQAVIALLPARYEAAMERLGAPGVTARTGVRLGGAQVGPRGDLHSSAATFPGGAGFLSLHLAPGSAALVTLTPAR